MLGAAFRAARIGKPCAFGVTGTSGNDLLLGTAAVDIMSAGGGNDTINGGTGTDVCIGGPGTDTFRNCETQIQ